jgi:hypothetical protein
VAFSALIFTKVITTQYSVTGTCCAEFYANREKTLKKHGHNFVYALKYVFHVTDFHETHILTALHGDTSFVRKVLRLI